MISADRLAELQADASRANDEYGRLQEELQGLGEAANASVGTEAQTDRFAELMDNYSRYTGTLDEGTYARLQAQRALAGMPTAEANAFAQTSWEAEKARRTAEDPTWTWNPCSIGPEVYDIEEGDPTERYDAFLKRAGETGFKKTTNALRAEEGPVDPEECVRRKRRWQELQTTKRFYEQQMREAENLDPVLKGLLAVGDWAAENVLGSLPLVGQIVGNAYKVVNRFQPGSKFYDPEVARRGMSVGEFIGKTTVETIKGVGLGKATGFVKGKALKYAKDLARPHTNTIRALAGRIAKPLSSVRNLQARKLLPNDAAALLNRRN